MVKEPLTTRLLDQADALENYTVSLLRQAENQIRAANHDIDCPYWKWDWEFSWAESDCTCN